jgi:hypothetical protein
MKRVFQFEASGDLPGKFSYYPGGDWTYTHRDQLRFETKTGPFTIQFIRKDVLGAYPEGSYLLNGTKLVADKAENGVWFVEKPINDGLSEVEREALRSGNASQEDLDGFIAKYFYSIDVTDARGQRLHDDQKNGTYDC